jgi:hypothetical protein
MNTFTLRLLTAIILFVFSVALCGFDYRMSWADNDATISKLLFLMDRRALAGDVDGVQLLGWHPDRAPVHASNPALRTNEGVSNAAF